MEDERKEEDKQEVVAGFKSVQEFSGDGFKRVVNAVKAFQALPQPGPSWDLYKSYPEFSKSMKNARAKMVPMMVSLLKHVNIPASEFKSRDVDEKFDFLVDSNDELLERIGTALDDAEGIFKKGDIVVVDKAIASTALKPPGTWGKRKFETLNSAPDLADSQSQSPGGDTMSNREIKKARFRTRVTEKPQLKFSQPIDNSTAPFVPKLKEKPHSLKPLSILPEYNVKNEEFYGHPYTVELNKWEPKDHLLTKVTPTPPKPLKETPVVYVSSPRDLERLMYDLLNVTEIAVDLEHHSYRTYLGLTCTIQISSRQKDYVIDGFSLRDQLSNLNEIFTDPKIVKVFHGASNDIDWLQRDFGVYVVNMFDTYIASKVLGLPQHSLQYLLGKYCGISQNKSLQLADWRIRPLPDEMVEYARQDTHFLLFIYDQMRNELIEAGNQHQNLLLSVYDQSRLTCLKRYEKPVSNAQLAIRKTRRSLNNRQLYAFTEIYKWRDEIAREKDESLGYVLPNHMLLTIAETLPKEMNGILACCDPVPPLIHSNLGRIHKIITTARELPLHQQNAQKDKVEKKAKLKNWMVAVNSIHDICPIEVSELTSTTDEEKTTKSSAPADINLGPWPQSWTEPEGWQDCLKKGSGPTLRFNRMRIRLGPKTSESFSQTKDAMKLQPESLTTPFGRYEISKNIIEMMKDPVKQGDLDMSDPLVKTVYEAVMLVNDAEEVKEVEEERLPAAPAKVFDEGQFVPFNPMAGLDKTSRKRKKNKHEAWDDNSSKGNAEKGDDQEIGIGTGMDVMNSSDCEEVAEEASSMMKQPKKTRRKRKGGKLMDRIKNVFHRKKRSNEKSEDREDGEVEDDDDVEIIEADDEPPSKRGKSDNDFKDHQRNSSRSQGRRSGRDHGKFNSRGQNRGSDQQGSGRGRGFQKGDRGKNKAGIFNAWKKDHRSVTYK